MVKKTSKPSRLLARWKYMDRRYRWLWRAGNLCAAGLIIFTVTLPVVQHYAERKQYDLTAAVRQLVGVTDTTLSDKLEFNQSANTYEFNADILRSSSSLPSEMLANATGTANKSNTKSYALSVNQDMSKGVTYTDANSRLSFSMVPEFKAGLGKKVTGHLVFPLADGQQAVYTLKNNGLKEDIIVPQVKKDTLSYRYRLDLPKTLEARPIPGGGGALGIYSADPTLFGAINYATKDDEARVQKARESGAKTQLVFGLPAPVIVDKDGPSKQATGRFELRGNQVTVVAENLQGLQGPISIDPSVVVTSASDFQTGGNDEGMINLTTAGQLSRSALDGPAVGTWSGASTFTTARLGMGMVARNGFLYLFGGDIGSSNQTSSVVYAPLTGGSIGTWTDVGITQLPDTRGNMAATTYNGYVYLVGGSGPSGKYNDVLVNSFNADGTLGPTWTSTGTMPTARSAVGTTAYNGYLYAVGGRDTANVADVLVAPILGNGTLGAFTATTSFANARVYLGVESYNGFIYVIGGDTGNGSSGATMLNNVQYAPINSDGTVGTWNNTTSFGTVRTSQATTIYHGYIFVSGGYNTSFANLNDVQYAPIDADGSVGTWSTTTNIPTARYGHRIFGANGYLYMAGGDAGGRQATAYSVQFSGAGTARPFTTAANSPATARAGGSSVAYNGYLYLIGGCSAVSGDTCTTPVTTVSYATISNSGAVGTWANTTNALPAAAGMGSAVVYEGRVYYFSGRPTSTTVSNTIYYVSLSATTGNTTAAWTSVTPTGLAAGYGRAAAIWNDIVYLTGGCTTASGACSAALTTVSVAKLSPSGGFATNPAACGNQFCPTTTITTARWGAAATVTGNRLYVSGGVTTTPAAQNDVQVASIIPTTGLLNTWASAGTGFTTARYSHALFAQSGYLYISGGKTATGTFVGTTFYAKLDTTGAIVADSGCGTAWCTTSAAAVARGGSGYAQYNGTLFLVSGQDANATVATAVYTTIINNGGQGGLNTWGSVANNFATARFRHGSFAANGFIYVVAGCSNVTSGNCTNYLADVQFAPITAGGAVGAWRYTHDSVDDGTTFVSGLPAGRDNPGVTVYNGYVYVTGGVTTGNTYLNTTLYAKLNANGTIGTWTAGTNFVNARSNPSPVGYKGYLYIFGGAKSATTVDNDVQYAVINSNGSLGAWNYTFNSANNGTTYAGGFTTARSGHATTVANGFAYVTGGLDSASASISDVQYAPLNANGTIGTWKYTTRYAATRSPDMFAAYNGYMYMMGGITAGAVRMTDTQFAPILDDGSLGEWNHSSSFTTARGGAGGLIYNGYSYIVGGDTAANVYTNTSEFVSMNTITRIGRYSKLVDLGSVQNVTGITYNGTLQGGITAIRYKIAGANGIFSATPLDSDSTATCAAGQTTGRYVLVTIVLDDSTNTAFPDDLSSIGTVTDFTVNFKTYHPPAAIRMRLGKTLQSGGQSPLDTCFP